MPAYNAARYLGEAVESVLTQTFADFELLVIDDGSSDQTPSIAQQYARADPRVRFLPRSHRGLVAVLNEGCREAKARYIARLDADDVALPDRLDRQVAFLDEHPDVALLGGGMTFIREDGTPFRDSIPPLDHDLIVLHLSDYNCFYHSSVLFRRSAWQCLGGYRDTLRHAEDYDLWLRMSERYQVGNLPSLLGCYRSHDDRVSITHREQQIMSAYAARAAAKIRRSRAFDPCDSVKAVTRDFVIQLGIDESQINAAILQAHLRVAFRDARNLRLRQAAGAVRVALQYFWKHGGGLHWAETARYKPRM
jgi:glycosyltransferase involved in cell wall biosynthesis